MENKEELYDENEKDILNKLGMIAKEFQDVFNEKNYDDNEEKSKQ